MLKREGGALNHKRVHRLYRTEGLQLRMRVHRRKHMCPHRGEVPKARQRHERLSMVFVHDRLFNGRRFRILAVVDQWSRKSVLMKLRSGCTGQIVADVLERWACKHGVPASITVDPGSEFTSKALEPGHGSRA